MPVIVVGADTSIGWAVIAAMASPDREVRAFVSDPTTLEPLRELGVKVAVGDVSDGSHIEAAASGCFTAVLVSAAAGDGRELAFAGSAEEVLETWGQAIRGVQRAIWIDSWARETTPECTSVDPKGMSHEDVAAIVAGLDDAASI